MTNENLSAPALSDVLLHDEHSEPSHQTCEERVAALARSVRSDILSSPHWQEITASRPELLQRLQSQTSATASDIQLLLEGQDPELLENLIRYPNYKTPRDGPTVVRILKKMHEKSRYGDSTQERLAAAIDMQDYSLVAHMLLDQDFTNKKLLINKIPQTLGARKRLLDALGLRVIGHEEGYDVVDGILRSTEDERTKYQLFRQFSIDISNIRPHLAAELIKDEWRKTTQGSITRSLIEARQYSNALEALCLGYISMESVLQEVHKIDRNDMLDFVSRQAKNQKHAAKVFSCMSDPQMLGFLPDRSKRYDLTEDERRITPIEQECFELSLRFQKALRNQPSISQMDSLHAGGSNKFVLGLASDNKWVITWSNIHSHPNHSDIVRSLESYSRSTLYPDSISGGYIGIQITQEGVMARFHGSSGSYGNYGHLLLKTYVPQITATLETIFKAKVIVQVDVSS